MTGAEFQRDTHPLTDEIRLSHKCNLRTYRLVPAPPPLPHTHRIDPSQIRDLHSLFCQNATNAG